MSILTWVNLFKDWKSRSLMFCPNCGNIFPRFGKVEKRNYTRSFRDGEKTDVLNICCDVYCETCMTWNSCEIARGFVPLPFFGDTKIISAARKFGIVKKENVAAILGAKDPEMDLIENLLKQKGFRVYYAKTPDDKRVHAGNAYSADWAATLDVVPGMIFYFECGFSEYSWGLGEGVDFLSFDHHREGDYGYGKRSELFWEASSIGQLWEFLHPDHSIESVPKEVLCIAAMDHCFNAAVHGKCPGVSKEEVLETKIRDGIMKTLGVSREAVLEEVEKWRREIWRIRCADREDSYLMLAGKYAIIVPTHTGIGYSLSYLSAQVAAVLCDKAVVLRSKQTADDMSDCLMLCGYTTEEMIKEFMDKNPLSLKRVFGNPARGYAGGYVDRKTEQ